MMKFATFVTGYKGYKFLSGLQYKPSFVVSYDNKERRDKVHYNKIAQWCDTNKVDLYERKQFTAVKDITNSVDKIFVVGWQYLIKKDLEKIVIFHDSYLPNRRGFAPTISYLLDKSSFLGVTCFNPLEALTIEPDYGRIYYRKKIQISYPIGLKEAFDLVSGVYIQMAHELIEKNTIPKMIDYSESTFSLWRDEEDFRIDWSQSSITVQQKILSLGFPYMGATTLYDDQIIYIQDAEEIDGVRFENIRDNHGKIWKIENNCPYIVCGNGAIKIIKAVDAEDQEIAFSKIRKRLK